ncbi:MULTISPECIES: dethiobiotin synthase [Methylobacterium]|jgi:dethiobiotin synthetase|uniref:ATP-dependent dethiobiotin synthetase BioD n=1 Tax=Methylobacterium longum TaxID=767694 RepID=A0ABT8ASP6_9HYPH|nr:MULTISPECIES: dethiobiotin synthase [Methylobacterium]MCJ2099493.1 dethiobiotin synthase [Methylobacterium sp. E-046]MDN3572697.1 dethiobiotin synthase [Methylobacterium longum]GJE12369.1 ATP-dependent dethiobiotin synthetase BioD [Methylobacterium longum]
MPPRAVFVAGAGTEIGKTYVTAALTRRLRERGLPVETVKPLASGVPPLHDPGFAESDTARLLDAQDIALDAEAVETCSPWRFSAPLSPDQAAILEGRSLDLADLVEWCRARIAGTPGTLLIEGVGGLMSPVTATATGLDWLRALDIPALLVSGSYLGAISHALTACETLRRYSVPLRAVVVSESPGAPAPAGTVAASIARHAGAPVVCLRRGEACPGSLADLIVT